MKVKSVTEPAYPNLRMIINGNSIPVGKRRTHWVVNPATEAVLGKLPLASPADLDDALATSERGFQIWRDSTAQQRASVLEAAAALLTNRVDEIAYAATLEQGKPLGEARGELLYVASLFRFYAGECQRIYGRQLVRPVGFRSSVVHEPVGPVAALAAWNFPLINPGRKLGSAIAAGCSVILKAAEETPASALYLVQALLDAGLPKEVAQAVFGVPDEVSRHLIASPIIRKINFTGSTAVGRHLMKLAAEDMKRTTMELGGHGPVLVFDDVDLEPTLDVLVNAKFRNCGQVCISPTRYIVHQSVYDKFRDGFIERTKNVVVGNGLEEGTQMGPMANLRRPDAIQRLIGDAIKKGATLHTGGKRIGNRGFFYAPSVLSDVPLDAAIMNDEPFGPIAVLNSYVDEATMIAEANRLPYGLAAYAWTADAKRQRRLARELEAGMVGINMMALSAVDSPFGGVKWSGHGSDDGPEGLLAHMTTKAVHEG